MTNTKQEGGRKSEERAKGIVDNTDNFFADNLHSVNYFSSAITDATAAISASKVFNRVMPFDQNHSLVRSFLIRFLIA